MCGEIEREEREIEREERERGREGGRERERERERARERERQRERERERESEICSWRITSGPGPKQAGEVADGGCSAGVHPADPQGDPQHVGRRVTVQGAPDHGRRGIEQPDLNDRAREACDYRHDGASGCAVENGPVSCCGEGQDSVENRWAVSLRE